jgi:hypothetical protein
MVKPEQQGARAAGRRIQLIAQHTLAEAVHLRLTFGLGLVPEHNEAVEAV